MRKLDFFKLPREKQERFLASTRGSAPPAPVVQQLGDGGRSMRFGVLAALSALVLLGLLALGYGSLGSGLAVQGAVFLAFYLGLFFLLPFGALRVLRGRILTKALPFKPGIYLFPMSLIDARTADLGVYPMADLSKVDKAKAGGALVVAFKRGPTFSFAAGGKDDVQQLNYRVDVAREQAKHALESGDDNELTTLDPFHEPKKGWISPIAPKQPLTNRTPAWIRFDALAALVLAIVLAPSSWMVRNKASDDSMYAKAVAQATPDAYRAYLSAGHGHEAEVRDVLLPRAELEIAKKLQTVEGIRGFLASHPGSAIDVEAQAALHDAFLRELEKAKKKSSLAGLEEFQKAYPDAHLDAELARARHTLYDGALARFKARKASDDPMLQAFVEGLARHLETHGPVVTMVFQREVSPALAQADKLIGAAPPNRAFGPRQVTRWFDPTAEQPKEADVARAIEASLREIFAPDLVSVTLGPDVDEATAAELAAKGPLLSVRYRFGWLGVAYPSPSLKRAFAGVHVSGEATFSVPGHPAPLHIRLEVPPSKSLLLEYKATHPGLSSAGPPNPDAPEKDVYLAMDLRALDLIASALEQAIIRAPK